MAPEAAVKSYAVGVQKSLKKSEATTLSYEIPEVWDPGVSRTHLSVYDVRDIPGGQQGHPDILQQVGQQLFTLLLGVLHPGDDGLKDRLFRIHLSTYHHRSLHCQLPHKLREQSCLLLPSCSHPCPHYFPSSRNGQVLGKTIFSHTTP